MTQSPPWAPGSGTGFTPPSRRPASPAEPLGAKPVDRADAGSARKRGKLVTVLLSALVIVLVATAGILTWIALAPADVEAPLPAAEFEVEPGAPAGATGDEPVTLDDGTVMTIADMAPNSVFIPAQGTYMPVEGDSTFVSSQYAGFDTLRVPDNAKHGVRYSAGAPMVGGDEGTTLIASHVSSTRGWGALRYLYQLRGGELVHTKDADGKVQTWQVTTMRIERHTEFPQEYWAADGTRQLVLTTCGGPREGGHFVRNIFAIATPVDPIPGSEQTADEQEST